MYPPLVSSAVALPEYSYTQEEISRIVCSWLGNDREKAAKAASILGNAEVGRRYTVRPAEWYLAHTSVTERSEVYREGWFTYDGVNI